MNFFILLFVLTMPLMASCSALSERERYANQIINNFAAQQGRKNRLSVMGTGSSIPDKVRSLFISLVSNRKLTLDEARPLYLSVVQDFIKMANDDGRLAPYAQNWPFNENNIKVDLSFLDRNCEPPPPYVSYIFMMEGIIYYNQHSPQTGRLVGYHKEPYAEAVRIVNGTAAE